MRVEQAFYRLHDKEGCVDEWNAWLESQDCPEKKW
jgi:hypothetical protein